MRCLRSSILSLFVLLGATSLAACGTSVGRDQGHATSCEGAHLDDHGYCRSPNGWFAARTCCEPLSHPEQRRSLEAYGCPDDGEAVPVAFFDADSTLRVSRSGAPTANETDDVYVLPFVAPAIRALEEEGYLVAVVSNQGGVAAGYTTVDVAEGALVFLAEQLNELDARVDYLDFAEADDEFRKPDTGMADRLAEELDARCGADIDWERSFMVGDAGYEKDVDDPHPDGRPADDFSNSDRHFAGALGIEFTEPNEYFDWRRYEIYNIHSKWDLLDALEAMEDEAEALTESGDDPDRLEAVETELEAMRSVNDLEP